MSPRGAEAVGHRAGDHAPRIHPDPVNPIHRGAVHVENAAGARSDVAVALHDERGEVHRQADQRVGRTLNAESDEIRPEVNGVAGGYGFRL